LLKTERTSLGTNSRHPC